MGVRGAASIGVEGRLYKYAGTDLAATTPPKTMAMTKNWHVMIDCMLMASSSSTSKRKVALCGEPVEAAHIGSFAPVGSS